MDLYRFMDRNLIDNKVILVGHSLGGKVAMMFSILFPEKVLGLCTLDSPPSNRNLFPEMNQTTINMMKDGAEVDKII